MTYMYWVMSMTGITTYSFVNQKDCWQIIGYEKQQVSHCRLSKHLWLSEGDDSSCLLTESEFWFSYSDSTREYICVRALVTFKKHLHIVSFDCSTFCHSMLFQTNNMFPLYTDYMLNVILFLKIPLGAVLAIQPFIFRHGDANGYHCWLVI
jgi:hypothetical protein